MKKISVVYGEVVRLTRSDMDGEDIAYMPDIKDCLSSKMNIDDIALTEIHWDFRKSLPEYLTRVIDQKGLIAFAMNYIIDDDNTQTRIIIAPKAKVITLTFEGRNMIPTITCDGGYINIWIQTHGYCVDLSMQGLVKTYPALYNYEEELVTMKNQEGFDKVLDAISS